MTAVGTALYAPQARLVDMASGQLVGATTTATASGKQVAVAPDLISVTVTLPNTGIGHLEVVLNNQRFAGGGPIFPPWKYNNFAPPATSQTSARTDGLAAISFGQRIRLDMRYGDGTWVKMIAAQVTDLKFTFPSTGAAQLTVIAEDLVSLLNIRRDQDKRYDGKQEEDIVADFLSTVYTTADQRPQLAIAPDARQTEGRTQPLRTVTHPKSQSYFQFASAFADRMDYELWLSFQNIEVAAGAAPGPLDASSELRLNFAPARSKLAPPAAAQTAWDRGASGDNFHYILKWGATLIDFTPTFKVFEMPTSASAVGTQPGKRARETQTLDDSELTAFFQAELPQATAYPDLVATTAVAARTQFFDNVGVTAGNDESSPAANLDAPRLRMQALAQFAKRVREFMTAEATVIGLPKLRAGTYVEIVGLRPPFDGYYYLCKTIHTLADNGYRTKLSLRRPGMLPPEAYLQNPSSSGGPS